MKQLGALLLPFPAGGDASPLQGTQHEATGVLLLPPGWDASPSLGTQHEATGVLLFHIGNIAMFVGLQSLVLT